VGGTADEFTDFIKRDVVRYSEIAKAANIEKQ
jgi:tripartite-type tricarboxylate transporter receptor subunit TctC